MYQTNTHLPLDEDQPILTEPLYVPNYKKSEWQSSATGQYLTGNFCQSYVALNQFIVYPNDLFDTIQVTVTTNDPNIAGPSSSKASHTGSRPTSNIQKHL